MLEVAYCSNPCISAVTKCCSSEPKSTPFRWKYFLSICTCNTVTQYCDLWVFLPLIQQIIIMWLDGKKRARVLRPKIPLIAFIYRNYFSWIFFRCFEINNCAGIIWGNKGGADICERVRKGIEVDLENGSPAVNEREPVNTIRVRTPVAEDEKEDLEDAETLRLYIRLSVNDWKVRWPYNIFQQLPESHFQLLWRGHTDVSV